MNCCEQNGNNCHQGRDCPARKSKELPITMEDEPPFSFDWLMRVIWEAMRWVGVVLLIAVIAFVWGFKS